MQNYSFDQVNVIVGTIPITGFGEGDDVIQVERRTDTFGVTVGVDGDGVAAKSSDKSGTFLFRLLANSASNTFLVSQFALMEANILPFLPVVVKDASTQLALATTLAAVITKPGPIIRGGAAPEREWTLLCDKLVML
jgi:hypothetical protein